MPATIINEEKYQTVLGPYFSTILDLKVFFNSTEIKKPFLFDTGSDNNFLKMVDFVELCGKRASPIDITTLPKRSATIANGEKIEFHYMKKIVYIKLGKNYYFSIPFIVNDGIHKNILSIKKIPEKMLWLFGKQEFSILMRE